MSSESSSSGWSQVTNPPSWMFIVAPIATLVLVAIVTIIVLVVHNKKVKAAKDKVESRNVSSNELKLLGM